MQINLKETQILWYGGIKCGRKEKFLATMSRLQLQATHIPPFISDDPVNAVRIGCGKSHAKSLAQSIETNKPTLILEDDVAASQWYRESFEVPDNADAVYLGTCLNGLHPNWKQRGPDHACCAKPMVLERLPNYYRISGMLTTHAILYIKNGYKKKCHDWIVNDNGNNHCDVLMASHMQENYVYAVKYPMFFQDCLHDNKDAYEKTIVPLWKLFR